MTILIVIISIVFLLVIHELGHFLIAKRFGVKVEEFGVGYPPRIVGKKFGDTVYSLNWIPFGAFVKIPGEEGGGGIENYRNFGDKPIWQRMLIIAGGVISFWIVAAILLTFVYGMGIDRVVDDDKQDVLNPKVHILGVSPDSPASSAGIMLGDIIKEVKVDGKIIPISSVKEVQEVADQYEGKEIEIIVSRISETMAFNLVPRVSPPAGEGAIGVSLIRTAEQSYPWWQCPWEGIKGTVSLTKSILYTWGDLISGLVSGQGMPQGVQFVGPIGIGNILNQAAQVGASYYLQFIAMIAVYLAILNILPIPALDGGKLLFLLIEWVRRKPVNVKIEQRLTNFFFLLLILLMIFVTIRDVMNFF